MASRGGPPSASAPIPSPLRGTGRTLGEFPRPLGSFASLRTSLATMDRRALLQLLGSAALTPALGRLSPEQRLDIARLIHTRLGADLKVLTPAQNALVVAVAEAIIPK